MSADGTAQTRITFHANATNPTWSPQGTTIAYEVGEDDHSVIWVVNTDGSGAARLTAGQSSFFSWDPSWSPDGTKIAFSASRPGWSGIHVMNSDGSQADQVIGTRGWGIFGGTSWSPNGRKIAFHADFNITGLRDIYVINANGSRLRRLTKAHDNDFDPAWSPDGKKIAFTSWRDGNAEVYVMNTDGSREKNVTRSPATYEARPSWRPR